MNLRHLVAVALGCAAVLRSQTPGDDFRKRPVVVSNRVQVSAGDRSPFKAGQPVEVVIRSKNVSRWTVRVGDSGPGVDLELVVTDTAGREPPRTDLGKRAFDMEVRLLSYKSVDPDPGQGARTSIDLTKSISSAFLAPISRAWRSSASSPTRFSPLFDLRPSETCGKGVLEPRAVHSRTVV